jgi:hypothetical protein
MFNLTTGNVLPVPTGSQGAPPAGVVQPIASSTGVRCIAIVTWKVEGNQVRRVIDVGSGVTISGVSQSVDVQVQDQSWTVFGPAGVQYDVSALVSRGVRPSTSLPPILYSAIDQASGAYSIAPGASVIVPVPIDSGVVSAEVSVYDTTTPATEPVFLEVQQRNALITNKIYSPVMQPGFVKIVGNSDNLRITNNSGADTVYVTVTWGIDG